MPDQMLATGQSEIAQKIVDALGLAEFAVKSLVLTIDAESAIKAEVVIYPTEEQFKKLGGEIEKLAGFGRVIGKVEFFYRN